MGFGGPHAAFIAARERGGTGAARPPRRGEHRHRGPAGAAPRPADPRAAHPPREGDVEHLHRPGAAGQHRRPLRRVARPRRAAGASPSGSTGLTSVAAPTPSPGPASSCVTTRGSTRSRSTVSTRPTRRSPRPPTVGLDLRRVDADDRRHQPRRDDRRSTPSSGVARRSVSPSTPPLRRRRRSTFRRDAPHRRVPHPGGVQPLPHRARDAALPAPPRRPRPRPRPHDDPARLVHDEAQRHHRDGADHVARVRRPAPVRPGRRDRSGYRGA